ncbi:type 1 periplasmic-binding domain-containing protein [Streptosporangium soli]|nr:hypothetical protein [Streptosporangium sp. KLBMP 9127]
MGAQNRPRSLVDISVSMVRRARLRDRFLPIVVFVGEVAGAATAARRFVEPVRRRVPFAAIEGPTEAQSVADLLGHVAGERGDMGARVRWSFLPAPRFPLAQFVLWALGQREQLQEEAGRILGRRAKQMEFNQPLRLWLTGRGPSWQAPLARAEYITRFLPLPVLATGSVSFALTRLLDVAEWANVAIWAGALLVAFGFATLSAANWSSGHFRYRWFKSQRYLPRERSEALAAYALRIAEAAGEPGDLVDRLLVNAFHEDLRVAYRRLRPWLLWPGWGRSAHAVLLLPQVGRGDAAHRLLTLTHDVRAAVGRPVPLLVVAGAAEPPFDVDEHRHVDVEHTGDVGRLPEVYERWREAAQRPTPCPYLLIDLPPDGLEDLYGGLPAPRADRRERALVYWAVVALVVAAPLFFGVRTVLPPVCAYGLTMRDGQCVGYTTSIESFDDDLKPLLALIQRQNAEIPAGVETFTVVYFGTLTRAPVGQDHTALVGTAGELIGVAARQRDYNESADAMRMRVTFANAGYGFANAEFTARRLAEQSEDDESVAAVVGLGWSREEVRRAVGVLGNAQLPMVSTTSTADSVARVGESQSAYFFRLAAPNSRQALVAVEWMTGIGLEGGGKPVVTGSDVTVLSQVEAKELYSEDLADEFDRVLEGTSRKRFADAAQLRQAVREACDGGAKLLYFTGRARYLHTLRDAWRSHCADGVVTMAGDDVISAVADSVHGKTSDQDLELFFVALTDARVKDGVAAPTGKSDYLSVVERWIARAREDKVALPRYSSSHAWLGHDAVLVVTEAFSKFTVQGGGRHVRNGIHYNLRGLGMKGASGQIAFSDGVTGHDALNRPLWLMSVRQGHSVKVHGICRPTATQARCEMDGK